MGEEEEEAAVADTEEEEEEEEEEEDATVEPVAIPTAVGFGSSSATGRDERFTGANAPVAPTSDAAWTPFANDLEDMGFEASQCRDALVQTRGRFKEAVRVLVANERSVAGRRSSA